MYQVVSADMEAFEQAYQAVWARFRELPSSCDCPTFQFTDTRTYVSLLRRFRDQDESLFRYYYNEVRADWDVMDATLTLRLTHSYVHEGIQEHFTHALYEAIGRIARQYPTLQPFCQKVSLYGHADIKDTDGSKKSPDGQIFYSGARHPLFILEVAYSQGEKNLLRKIPKYFDMIDECTVLVIDLEYATPTERKSHSDEQPDCISTVSPWTSVEDGGDIAVNTIIDRDRFRQDGQAQEGDLIIPFSFLLPWAERSQARPDVDLRFSFAELSNMVSQSQATQRNVDTTPSPPSRRKRKFYDQDGKEMESPRP